MATEYNAQARANNGDFLEKDFSGTHNGQNRGQNRPRHGSNHLDDMSMDSTSALKRIQTAGSISISPELFEKIYLSPQNAVKGDLRKTFGNPTPLCVVGFLLSLSPLTCQLMGWRGAGGDGASDNGVYYFFGGLLMIVGGFLEFILGNTFPFVVFMSFGAFWLSFGATLTPFYNSYGFYAPAGGAAAEGLATQSFNASFSFFLVFMGVLCFIYLICSLRTNVVFVIIFLTLVLGFACLSATFFYLAEGYGLGATTRAGASLLAKAGRLQIAGGACLFVTCMAGWWLLFAIMLAALDFPFQIPVGDLSSMIKGYSEKEKMKKAAEHMA